MADSSIEPAKERRDSPRVPMRFLVRSAADSDFQQREGDLSLGGVAYLGAKVTGPCEIRLRLPNAVQELLLRAEPLGDGQDKVHLRFVDLDTATELTIARYLDDLAGAR